MKAKKTGPEVMIWEREVYIAPRPMARRRMRRRGRECEMKVGR